MPVSTGEDQGEGQDLRKRQRCDNGVPISTRYEASTITTYYVSYSYYTPPPRSTDPLSEAPTPASTTRTTYYTLKSPRPPISLELRTSTTWLPPKKSVVPTTSEVIAKPRAIQSVPVTITRTIVTRIPVETIYSCPLSSSREPPTSRDDYPTSWSSAAPFTSWIEFTSRSDRPTIESTHAPSTRHQPTASPGEPWYHSSSTATSRSRPTGPPSTSPPPSTRPTSSIPPRTSPAPNSTTLWPPTTTSPSYSECFNHEWVVVYILSSKRMGSRSLHDVVWQYIHHDLDPDQYICFNSDYNRVAMQFLCPELGGLVCYRSRAMGPGIVHLYHVQHHDIFDRALHLVLGLTIRLGCGSLHIYISYHVDSNDYDDSDCDDYPHPYE
ncbi:unnamed protein product [Rhizoctonia solani]|nr:unnamed protein product [Rhizoctonia solani]